MSNNNEFTFNDIKNSFSSKNRILKQAKIIANKVLEKEDFYSNLSDAELRAESQRIMDEVSMGKSTDDFLVESLSLAREIIYRTYKQKAYKVQLIGAIIVYFGNFAEMKTGEGKTLTLLLVSYATGITRKGVHIITVNEYLVKRDAEFSNGALNRLGLTVGYITSNMDQIEKTRMYNCDITYAPNTELGFDYLRDNMVKDYHEKMQRGLNFAIVDEGDSILIDESRTPLIISGMPKNEFASYIQSDIFVKSLKTSGFIIDSESHTITLTEEGIEKAEDFFKFNNLFHIENSSTVHRILNSLRANFLFTNGKEYIVRRNNEKDIDEIALVDQFTGRILEGRSYNAGLHQAIQAKEYVKIEPENVIVATITYQSLFRMYSKLSAVSGTAATESEEFLNTYNMAVVQVPTNKPVIREDKTDFVFANKRAKWKAVILEVKKQNKIGQPILIGTGSVEDSEILHQVFTKMNLKHTVLNAKNHAREAEIIKNAGQVGAITIATNMAGRGTDIKLSNEAKELGGLYVVATEKNESRRIDNQLRGRSGRQGDVGKSRFYISLEDVLFKRFATDKFEKAQFKLGGDVIDSKFFTRLLDKTQERVENLNFDSRKNLLDYDYVLSSQRELIYKQRDKILISDNLLNTVLKMSKYFISKIFSENKHEQNIHMLDNKSIARILNDKYLDEDNKIDIQKIKLMKSDEFHEFISEIINEKLKIIFQLHSPNNQWKNIIISILDSTWTEHLNTLFKLREGVFLRQYEQKSPLNIYISSADILYNIMVSKTGFDIISTILTKEHHKPIENQEIPRNINDIFTIENKVIGSVKTPQNIHNILKIENEETPQNIHDILGIENKPLFDMTSSFDDDDDDDDFNPQYLLETRELEDLIPTRTIIFDTNETKELEDLTSTKIIISDIEKIEDEWELSPFKIEDEWELSPFKMEDEIKPKVKDISPKIFKNISQKINNSFQTYSLIFDNEIIDKNLVSKNIDIPKKMNNSFQTYSIISNNEIINKKLVSKNIDIPKKINNSFQTYSIISNNEIVDKNIDIPKKINNSFQTYSIINNFKLTISFNDKISTYSIFNNSKITETIEKSFKKEIINELYIDNDSEIITDKFLSVTNLNVDVSIPKISYPLQISLPIINNFYTLTNLKKPQIKKTKIFDISKINEIDWDNIEKVIKYDDENIDQIKIMTFMEDEIDSYDFSLKKKIWKKYKVSSSEPKECLKCKKIKLFSQTISLNNDKQICYFCWIKKNQED